MLGVMPPASPSPASAVTWNQVRERLHERGLRWTPQRRLLIDVLSRTDGHVTGAELVERCRASESRDHAVDRLSHAGRARGHRPHPPCPRARWPRGVPRPAGTGARPPPLHGMPCGLGDRGRRGGRPGRGSGRRVEASAWTSATSAWWASAATVRNRPTDRRGDAGDDPVQAGRKGQGGQAGRAGRAGHVLGRRNLSRALLARQLLLERSNAAIAVALKQVGGLQPSTRRRATWASGRAWPAFGART